MKEYISQKSNYSYTIQIFTHLLILKTSIHYRILEEEKSPTHIL